MRAKRRLTDDEIRWIYLLRDRWGFTHEAIAELAGVDRSAVTYWLSKTNVTTPRERAQYLVHRGAGL